MRYLLILLLSFSISGYSQLFDVVSGTSTNGKGTKPTHIKGIEFTNDWIYVEGAKAKQFVKVIYKDDNITKWISLSDNPEYKSTTTLENLNNGTYRYTSKGKFGPFWFSNNCILKLRPVYIGAENILEIDTFDPSRMIDIFKYEYTLFLFGPRGTRYENGKFIWEDSDNTVVGINLGDYPADILNKSTVNPKVTFKQLPGETVAVSKGMNNDELIEIEIDPDKWYKASLPERWYIIYHEMGHDLLNLEHGQGGRMMFNYSYKNVTWRVFFDSKNRMFEYYWNRVPKK